MKRHFSTMVIAVFMAVLMAVISPLQVFAATKKVYLSEIRTSDNKEILRALGYTVIEEDLNAGAGDAFTYMGYKTTTDPDEAITDISIMDMKGGYSFSDYETMLEQQRKAVTERLSTYRVAINEFTQKYKSKSKAAILAHETMNGYIEDDSGRLIGDMLVDPTLSDDDLIKIFMQGTFLVNSVIAECLAIGLAAESEENWMSRIAENEETTHDGYDEVLSLTNSIEYLRDSLNEYLDTGLRLADKETNPDAFAGLTDDELLIFVDNGTMYEILSSYGYKDKTVADLFLTEDYEIEDFYPLIASLTPGQLAIASICGFKALIKTASVSDSVWEDADDYSEGIIEDIYGEEGKEKLSIYTGVDRDMYKGGVALTSDAMRKSASTGDSSWWCGNMNSKLETAMVMTTLTSGLLLAGFYAACKSLVATVTELSAASMDLFTVMYNESLYQANRFLPKGAARISFSYDLFAANQMSTLTYAQTMLKVTNIAAWITGAIFCVITGLYLILEVYNYYNPDYTEIPLVLMDLKFGEDDDIGDWEKYIKYNVVLNEGGTAADLNGFSAKQWNAMYVTKDKAAGNPILADSITVQYGNSSTQRKNSCVHYFGAFDAYNLNTHCYDDTVKGIFMFFRGDEAFASETASVFGSGVLVVVAGFGGLIIGVLGAILITKKKKQ